MIRFRRSLLVYRQYAAASPKPTAPPRRHRFKPAAKHQHATVYVSKVPAKLPVAINPFAMAHGATALPSNLCTPICSHKTPARVWYWMLVAY